MEATSKQPTSSDDSATNSEPTELPERGSAPRKTELVLRLLRGESLDRVSRDSQVLAHARESWKRAFLEAGMRGLNRHVEPEDRELIRTRATIGELTMRLELAQDLIETRGLVDEWRKPTPCAPA